MLHSRYDHRAGIAFLATVAALLSPNLALADNQSIVLEGEGGDAWTFEKSLEGRLRDGGCDRVLLASPRGTVEAWQADGRFGAVVPLFEGDNEVRAICRLGTTDRSVSQPQHWRVRLRDAPKAWPRVVPVEDGVALNAGASERAPARSAPIIEHQWRSEPGNPQPLTTADGVPLGDDPVSGAELLLRTPGMEGEYQVRLRVTDALGRTDESTAAFLVENGRARGAELAEERPAWLDSAVIYAVVPFFFGSRGFDDVTARLDAIKEVAATVLWRSPITGTEEGDFGYAVTDHFGLRDAFGTEQDLRELITAADARGLRVIMDFVPNHTSEQHPYYLSAEQRGPASPYYDFYDRNAAGEVTTYFDWENLKKPELRQSRGSALHDRGVRLLGPRVRDRWLPGRSRHAIPTTTSLVSMPPMTGRTGSASGPGATPSRRAYRRLRACVRP